MIKLSLVEDLVIMAGARETAPDMKLVMRRLEILRPLEQLWLGERDYAIPGEIDTASALRAIAALAGTGEVAFEATVIADDDWSALPRRLSDYVTTFSQLLEVECAAGIKARGDSIDLEEADVISGVVRALMLYHATNGPAALMEELALGDLWRLIARSNEQAVTGCYLAIVHEDLAALRRVAPAARLLAQVLPIGVPKKAGPKWLIVRP
jgi:hypothetical protein